MHLNVTSGKWQPFCLSLNMLKLLLIIKAVIIQQNPVSQSNFVSVSDANFAIIAIDTDLVCGSTKYQ